MSVEENIKIVRRVIKAFNTGNTSNVDQFISPDYVNESHNHIRIHTGSKLKGPEEFTDTIKVLRSAFPDLHYEEQEIISQGNKVIFVGNVTGTHSGNFFFIPPTRNRFLMKQCTSIR